MKKQLLLVLLLAAILLSVSGCFSGTGFEKKTTLMPDSVGISFERLNDSDYTPWTVIMGAQWNLE